MEAMADATTIVFDKTGTLTKAKACSFRCGIFQ